MIDFIIRTFLHMSYCRVFGKRRLSILVYHRVLDQKDIFRLDMPTVEEFDKQMLWISRFFNVCSLSDAVDRLKKNTLPKRALVITFDDGYKDNITNALPILKKYNLSAAFFITTEYMGNNPWWDNLIESVRHTEKTSIMHDGISYDLSNVDARVEFVDKFSEDLKKMPEVQARESLLALIGALGVIEHERLMMDESDLRLLVDNAMEIGSHGVNHHILSRIPDDLVRVEVEDSREFLSRVTSETINSFAYPNGKYPVDLYDKHIRMVEDAGYDCALSSNTGCSVDGNEVFLLKRFTPWRRGKLGFLSELVVNYWKN